jgi:hypothetical protein
MKKFLAVIIFAFIIYPVFAAQPPPPDVRTDHWAFREIRQSTQNGWLATSSGGWFFPEVEISRLDFAAAVLKVLKDDAIRLNRAETVRVEQKMRRMLGASSRLFDLTEPIKRFEAMQAIANITQKEDVDLEILNMYQDKDDIPAWVRKQYAKNIYNRIYTNHPHPSFLRPRDLLTRAEAAALLVRLNRNLEFVDAKHQNTKDPLIVTPVFIAQDVLNIHPNAPRNTVDIYNTRIVIEAGNVLLVRFDNDFNSTWPNTAVGNDTNFAITENLHSNNGTLILPAQTRFKAKVTQMELTNWQNDNSKALIEIYQLALPHGDTVPMAAVVFTEPKPVKKGNRVVDAPFKKANIINKTVKFIGRNMGPLRQEPYRNDPLVIRSNLVRPTVHYDKQVRDLVYILLTGDLVIPRTQER